MAVNEKTDIKPVAYIRSPIPTLSANAPLMTDLEFQKVERSLRDLVVWGAPASDTAPLNPRRGMMRYAVGDWATSLGAEGLYIYKTAGWTFIV